MEANKIMYAACLSLVLLVKVNADFTASNTNKNGTLTRNIGCLEVHNDTSLFPERNDTWYNVYEPHLTYTPQLMYQVQLTNEVQGKGKPQPSVSSRTRHT